MTISKEQMGENFNTLHPICEWQQIIVDVPTLRALTDSLDKCRRRYQVRIRRLEQQCAGQGRPGVQGVQGLHQGMLVNNNTDTAESRSTRASSRTEEAL